MDKWYSIVWAYHILFVHLTIQIHLSCFHCEAFMKILPWIVMNKYLCEYVFTSLGYIPEVEFLVPMWTLNSTIWGSITLFLKEASPFVCHTGNVCNVDSNFLHIFFLPVAILSGMKWYIIVVFISILSNEVDHLVIYLFSLL